MSRILSTGGGVRYASYWNAFLFYFLFLNEFYFYSHVTSRCGYRRTDVGYVTNGNVQRHGGTGDAGVSVSGDAAPADSRTGRTDADPPAQTRAGGGGFSLIRTTVLLRTTLWSSWIQVLRIGGKRRRISTRNSGGRGRAFLSRLDNYKGPCFRPVCTYRLRARVRHRYRQSL